MDPKIVGKWMLTDARLKQRQRKADKLAAEKAKEEAERERERNG